jgi:hypothetical protein
VPLSPQLLKIAGEGSFRSSESTIIVALHYDFDDSQIPVFRADHLITVLGPEPLN